MVSFGIFLPKPCLFAVRWHNSWFSCLLGDDISDIHVPGWGGEFLPLFGFLYGFRTCRVGHLVWYRTFRIFDRNFQKILQSPLPDVTNPRELTKIVLQSSTKLPGAKFGTRNWNMKVVPFFQRNMQYRPRLMGPPCSFFRDCETFFEKILKSSKSQLFNFFDICNKMDVWKIRKGLPIWARQGLHKRPPARQVGPTFGFFGYCKREYLTLSSHFAIFEP